MDIDSAIKALNTRPNLVGPDQTRSNCSGWPDIIVVNTGRPWSGPRLQFSGEMLLLVAGRFYYWKLL